MLTHRQRDIIDSIPGGPDCVTSKQLSEELHISEKTVRNEIKRINRLFKEPFLIESHKSKGYCLNRNNEHCYYIFSDQYQYNEESFRREIQIMKLLMDHREVDILDVCDDLYIGVMSLKQDIEQLNERINIRNEHVSITMGSKKLKLNGNEEECRRIISYLLVNEIEKFNFSIENYHDYFSVMQIEEVKELLLAYFSKQAIKLRDLDIFSFMLHIGICLDRIQSNHTITYEARNDRKEDVQLTALFEEIAAIHQLVIPADEVHYLLDLFYTKLYDHTKDSDIQGYSVLIEQFLEELTRQFYIDLRADDELRCNLALHSTALMHRIKQRAFLKNPLLKDIKVQFPIIYDMGVLYGKMLEETYHLRLNEDEIGYLTLHLITAIEKQKEPERLRTAIVNPGGEASTRYMRTRLMRALGSKLEIIGDYSLFDVDTFHELHIDLIITTAVIIKDLGIKVEHCSAGVTDQDIQSIEVRIREIEELKSKKMELSLLSEDLFFPRMKFDNKEKVIRFLCKKLEEQGFCTDTYVNDVLDRENIAPASFGNYFAIPHPIRRTALKNGVAVCTLKNSIFWNGNKVNLILLFSSTKNEDVFHEIYDQIVVLLNHSNIVKKLCKITDFKEFVSLFYQDSKHS